MSKDDLERIANNEGIEISKGNSWARFYTNEYLHWLENKLIESQEIIKGKFGRYSI